MKIGLFFEIARARTWLVPGGAKWLVSNCLFQLCLFNEAIVPGCETISGTFTEPRIFPIFTRKEVETKKNGKEIKTIISRLNDLSSFLSNIEQNRN